MSASVTSITKNKTLPVKDDETIVFQPPTQERKLIATKLIDDTCWNSRENVDENSPAFQDLQNSIKQQNLKQDIVVTRKETVDEKGREYEIVAGFRRFRAMTKLGHKQIHCVIETYAHPAQRVIANLSENLHRDGLKPYELAMSCLKLKKMGFRGKQIAKWINYSESHVSSLLNCSENLIPQAMALFKRSDENTTIKELFMIARMTPAEQLSACNDIMNHKARNQIPEPGVKPRDPETHAKMKKREAVLGALGDLARGCESILVRGEEMYIRDDEERQKLVTALRWTVGELKKYPFVLPPDDVADQKSDDSEKKKRRR